MKRELSSGLGASSPRWRTGLHVALLSACCLGSAVHAQGVDTNTLRFDGARSKGTVTLPSPRVLEAGVLETSLSYWHEVGVVRATLPTGEVRGGNRAAATPWIDGRDALFLQFAGSPVQQLELLAGLPVLLGQGVTAIPSVTGPVGGASALGDLALGARYGVLQPATGLQWALHAGVRLPTGAVDQAFGEGTGRLDASTTVGWQSAGPWAVNGHLGYQMGSTLAFGDQVFGDRQFAGAGFAYRAGPLQVNVEALSSLVLAPAAAQTNPARVSLELLGGVRYLGSGFFADLGTGFGAIDAHVTPQWRMMASVGVQDLFAGAKASASNTSDRDQDGLADAVDQCPAVPEDLDGFEDDDGCPDTDNDADGVPDSRDACPLKAEDPDGVADGDGCPEEDADGDNLADAKDACPLAPEDFDGFEDEDGCPEAGAPNPATAFRAAALGESGVWFDTGKATLDIAAQNTLREIARLLLRSQGSVRLTGHADDQGTPQRNDELSRQRAEAVRDFLVQAGIATERLSVHAAGQREPITSQPGTGRSLNRSVTFQWDAQARD